MSKRTALFLIIIVCLFATAAPAETVSLPRTGIAACYDAFGEEIPCAATGQDGAIQAGLAWPATRFTVTGDCILDNLTGLTWAKNLSTERRAWEDTFGYIDSLNSAQLCNRIDWRLPNINELESLSNAGEVNSVAWLTGLGFTNVGYNWYWSSTSVKSSLECPACVFITDLSAPGGYQVSWAPTYPSSSYREYVWPVAGESTGPARVWRTGQTAVVHTGDDGNLREGTAWPSPRFTVDGDTATDNLAGLMWTVNANVPGPDVCLPGVKKMWQEALDYVKCLNAQVYLGYSDWRLPNTKEFMSIIDRSQYSPPLPEGHPFQQVQTSSDYWTSTSRPGGGSSSAYAWFVNMGPGILDYKDKRISYYTFAWPVRGGIIESTPRVLTVTLGGNKKGTVTAEGLACPKGKAFCTGTYNSGATVTLTPTANTGAVFDGWKDCDDVSGNVCHVTMNSARTVTATFDAPPAISASPMSINFGSVKMGAFSSKTVTVKNTGGAHLVVNSMNISGTTEFSAVPTGCGEPLAKGKSCTVALTLTPAPGSYGPKTGQFVITSTDPKKASISVKLTGSGAAPKISVSPASLNFGTILVQTTSDPRKITIKNTGPSDLSSIGISLAEGPFAVSGNDCAGKTLVTNGSCAVYVTFAASSLNKVVMPLTVTSNDPDPARKSIKVNLSGKGKAK